MKALGLLLILISFTTALQSHADGVQTRLDFLIGKKSTVEGPNCWNEATFVAGISKGLHHTSFDEFGFILDSPLCKPVTMEQAQMGDIVAFRRYDRDGRILPASFLSEVHGYSYVNSQMGLTKNGVMVEAVYEMMSHDDVYKFYRKSEYNNCKMMGFDRGHCNMKVQVYHCQDIESFLAQKNDLKPQEQEVLSQLAQIEVQVQEMVLSGKPLQLDPDAIAQMKKRTQELEDQGSSSFLVDYLIYRIDSVEKTQTL